MFVVDIDPVIVHLGPDRPAVVRPALRGGHLRRPAGGPAVRPLDRPGRGHGVGRLRPRPGLWPPGGPPLLRHPDRPRRLPARALANPGHLGGRDGLLRGGLRRHRGHRLRRLARATSPGRPWGSCWTAPRSSPPSGRPSGASGTSSTGTCSARRRPSPGAWPTSIAGTFAPQLGVAYHPAAVYELLFNLLLIAVLWALRHRLPRPGLLFVTYLGLYCVGQVLIFFWRNNDVLLLGLRQGQLTALAVLLLCVPLYSSSPPAGPRRWRAAGAAVTRRATLAAAPAETGTSEEHAFARAGAGVPGADGAAVQPRSTILRGRAS